MSLPHFGHMFPSASCATLNRTVDLGAGQNFNLSEGTMLTYIDSLPRNFRFSIPETNKLKQRIMLKSNVIIHYLSDEQLIAMTLNEVCVFKGQGKVWWVPIGSTDVSVPY